MSPDRLSPLTFCLMVFITLAGCQQADRDEVSPVKGVVIYQGNPLSGGSIQFIPDSSQGTTGRMATGKIGPDGTFELTTYEPGDGALPGHHKVTISYYESEEFDPENPTLSESKSLVPEKYGDPTQSGLNAEVLSGKENTFEFTLNAD
ncbi:hypothetical protein [Calycomorphotria hydatis]|uniref:Carboxypeptidase regulatory-like domain-containing protein n=1 Tax=Calycomorphotria hydatis TaxID=2528027 RepID=A0A517TF40_9PLAN|nr:hypothetical protein [Calycomorphotria hydatis]QDT66991.1 hypothetical protein V22_42630 [Calycomorphotria hydatis]